MPVQTTLARPPADLQLRQAELQSAGALEEQATQLHVLIRKLFAQKSVDATVPTFRAQATGLLDALESILSMPPPKTELGKEALQRIPRQLHFLEEGMAAAEVKLAESRLPAGAAHAKMNIQDPTAAAAEMAVAAHVLQRPVAAKVEGQYLVATDGVSPAQVVEEWQTAKQQQAQSGLLERMNKVAEATDALVHDAQAQPRLLSDVLDTFASASPPQLYRAWVERYVASHVRHPTEMRELLDFLLRTTPPALHRERLAAVLIGARDLSAEHQAAWSAAVADVAREAGLSLYADGALFPPPQAEPRPLDELLAACRFGDPDAAKRALTQDPGNSLLMGALKLSHPAEIALAADYLLGEHRFEALDSSTTKPLGPWESRQHAMEVLTKWIDLGCANEPQLWRAALAARAHR